MKIAFASSIALVLALAGGPLAAQTGPELLSIVAEHEAAEPPQLIDRRAFLQEPAIRTVLLAPDGAHVAWLENAGRETALHLLDTQSLQSSRLFDLARLRSAEWGADGKLVLDLGDAAGLLDPAAPAAPAFIARLDVRRGDYLLGASGAQAGGVLVVRKPQRDRHALELVDATGRAAVLFNSRDRIENALLASSGERIFVETATAQARHLVEVRDGIARTLVVCPVVTTCRLVSHDAASDTLWLLSSHDSDLLGLRALALGDGTMTTVHEDPTDIHDIDTVTTLGSRPVAAAYEAGARQYAVDAAMQEHLARIGELLPHRNITLSLAADGKTWLVTARSSVLREPRYYLYSSAVYDRSLQRDTSSGVLREILAEMRDDTLLPSEVLSRKWPLDYDARDGERVHGYVSFPKGVALREAPLVALPHGGPWAHVNADYFSLTQFLVNRGYIVFEPNFRGSTGYGRAWMEAARREFGEGAVQHDIIDGVRHLLALGIGDASRVGIVGGSFGGFSVLAGLSFTPELFKVGVAAVPPASIGSSVRHQLKRGISARDPATAELLRLLMVDIDDPDDMQRLHDLSPHAHLAAIQAPLLVIAGADDANVDIAHVKQYMLELVNLGKAVSLLVDEDEGHTMDSPLMWQAFFYATETMFARYLGGHSQLTQDPLLAGYLQRKLVLNTNANFVVE